MAVEILAKSQAIIYLRVYTHNKGEGFFYFIFLFLTRKIHFTSRHLFLIRYSIAEHFSAHTAALSRRIDN